MRRFIFICILSFMAWACNESAPQTSETVGQTNAIANASAEIEIRGMTCETGCKKLIEKNVRKMAGVTKFEVDFEHSSAYVEFDTSITDAEQIKEAINGINNGVYSAIVHEVSKL
ncbi:MAG: heavy-metal-associated domain-containing protein [Thermaurantimonas sp.]